MSEIVEVDTTGAAVELDVAAATRLDTRIRLMAGTVRDNLIKLGELVDEAKTGQIHVALGFASWTAYLADALGGQLELTTESRRAVVELLAGEGMSQRAIATAVGVSQKTVDRDLDHVSHGDSPEPAASPEPVTGLDGKTYTPKPKPDPKPEKIPPPATFSRIMRLLAKLTEHAEDVRDTVADYEFDTDAIWRGDVYEGSEQYDVVADSVDDIATIVDEIATTVGSVTAITPVARVAQQQTAKKLRTWYRGKSHEFASWSDVYAALQTGCISVGTIQAVLGDRGAVKITPDEAAELRDNMNDLHVALLVLLEHRPTGGEILAQSEELDHRATEIVADLFTTAPAEQIEEEPDEDGYTLWSPDVTITVTSRTDYDDLKPWVLSLYRHAADCDCHVWWDGDDQFGRFCKWLADFEDCADFDVFGATYLRLDPLYLITNMATWIAEEFGDPPWRDDNDKFGGGSIRIAKELLYEYGLWDYQITESIKKKNAAAGGDA